MVTTLTRKGMPVLRYRTKDITRLHYEPCACGRTHVRMDKVMGRTDDMLIIKGVNVFPSQIESVLVGMENVGPHYQLVVRKRNYLDTLEVKVELVDASLLESFGELRSPAEEDPRPPEERAGPGDEGDAGVPQEPGALPGQGQARAGFAQPAGNRIREKRAKRGEKFSVISTAVSVGRWAMSHRDGAAL